MIKQMVVGLMLAGAATLAMANDASSMGSGNFKDLDANGDGRVSTTEAQSHAQLNEGFRTADTNGGRLAQSPRHHESQRGDLQRDCMPRDTFGIDQAHEIGGCTKHRAFEGEGKADRNAQLEHVAEPLPVGTPPISEKMEAAELPIGNDHH